MKKALIAAAAAALLCGCGEAEHISLNSPFSCNISIQTESTQYVGSISRSDSSWTFTYNEPEEISGLVITCEDNSYEVTLGDLSFTGDRDALPDSAISTMIIAALDSASLDTEVKYTTEKNLTVARGNAGGMEYTAVFDSDCPQSLEIGEITVSFSDYKTT